MNNQFGDVKAWISYASIALMLICFTSVANGKTSKTGKTIVSYPQPQSASDKRDNYFIALLELALGKSGAEYELVMSQDMMLKGRVLLQLANGSDLDVGWAVTTKERESKLLAIKIPIDKGLIGWRIFLINKKARADFEKVQSLEQLKAFQGGQGHDWPDTIILRANGLKIYGSPNYENLFKMLQIGRFSYFPRYIGEIWDEEIKHQGMDIEIEQTIIIQYPSALYFFVNKSNKELAAAIERGLRVAMADGSFDKMFEKYYGELIRRSNIKNRKLFKLDNPLLPDNTPLEQKKLWFNQ